ncbi:MAG: glycosyltransferase [Phycisphaerae bacterium]|nr:glycosyltransferase [Phycisphaerae bacterium]
MRVAIVYLSGGGLSGGARSTLRALVPILRRDERIEKLDLFVPPRAMHLPDIAALQPNTWPARDRFFRHANLRRRIRSLRPDVVFIPNAAWFDADGVPTVCMVRNMEALLLPFGENPLREGVKNILRARFARRACQKSTRIIAVSRFVRDFLVDRRRLATEKIGVVYHGVPEAPPEEQTRRPAGLAEEDTPFWFSAGSFIPYRGYEDAIRAFAARVKTGRDERLVLAGGAVYSDAYLNRTKALARRLGVEADVRWVGHVDANRMAWCFRNALGFIMTSRLEACPNLVLEALANGALSISTTHPPMPEMYGPAALYYPAGDADSLGEAMDALAAMSPLEREEARNTARTRAREFSWDAAGRRTIEQLQRAVEKQHADETFETRSGTCAH